MKKIKLGRLQLDPQTIRVLGGSELSQAHGAGPRSNFGCSGSCETCHITACCAPTLDGCVPSLDYESCLC